MARQSEELVKAGRLFWFLKVESMADAIGVAETGSLRRCEVTILTLFAAEELGKDLRPELQENQQHP